MMNVKPYEIVIGIIGILATFELCRRAVGIPILCVASVFVIYALYYYDNNDHWYKCEKMFIDEPQHQG